MNSTFASNLRRFCSTKDSIAAVCRATNINRQQFNRYLSGSTLPNRATREKICCYFGVDEGALFGSSDNQLSLKSADTVPWLEAEIHSSLALLKSEVSASIPEGIYFADFAIPHDEDSIMRSVVIIRRDGNLTTFRRITGRSERRGSWWSNFDGDHRGIILDRRHSLYFMALNAYGHREPTLLVLQWLPSSAPLLGGMARPLPQPAHQLPPLSFIRVRKKPPCARPCRPRMFIRQTTPELIRLSSIPWTSNARSWSGWFVTSTCQSLRYDGA
ncbi:MAG: helix-turn-helix transcriptional regulator [Rhizobiales bacterium]|nr:helix-turn-helix transcriptional regulator [Hyphomicrobiales bacterium]